MMSRPGAQVQISCRRAPPRKADGIRKETLSFWSLTLWFAVVAFMYFIQFTRNAYTPKCIRLMQRYASLYGSSSLRQS